MTVQDDPCGKEDRGERPKRHAEIGAADADAGHGQCHALVVKQVVGERSRSRAGHVAQHAHVRPHQQKQVAPPWHLVHPQGDGANEQLGQFLQFEQGLHAVCFTCGVE